MGNSVVNIPKVVTQQSLEQDFSPWVMITFPFECTTTTPGTDHFGQAI